MSKKTEKTKVCRHCKEEIAKNAKRCPKCGGKQGGGCLTKLLSFFGIIIVLALALSMCGGEDNSSNGPQKVGSVSDQEKNDENKKDDDGSGNNKETEAVSEQTEFYVGDIVKDGDKQIVYMASGEYESDNEYMQPADGNKFIFLQFAVINTSNKSDSGISFYDFNCYADGYEAEMHYENDENLSATLSAGRATSGYVYFEVPENAENIEVEYEVNIWTDEKIKFIYEGDKDSGYVLPKNEEASEDAYEVGSVIETKSLRITYLSCEDYESDNMFVTPRDGYHFVCATLEFENISNSDEHVSSMSFDCFADGISCNQSYAKDDDLSATLSAGRKVKGSVVFEIPDKAKTVEIEYLDNFWTSGRVVFTVQ